MQALEAGGVSLLEKEAASEGDFRKYPQMVLEGFRKESTYHHVSGILKCSTNCSPVFRLSVPFGD